MGGIEMHVFQLARALSKKGHSVHIFTSTDSSRQAHLAPPYVKRNSDGYLTHYLHSKFGVIDPDLSSFDLIHIHEYFRSFADYLILRWRSKKIIITLHGGLFTPSTLKDRSSRLKIFHDRLVLPCFLSYVSKIITVSHVERDYIVKNFGISTDKINVIPNGIPPEVFNLSVVENTFSMRYILTIARINNNKGIDRAILSLSQLPSDVHYIVAGPDDGALDELRTLSEKLALSSRVHFVGIVSGKKKYSLISNSLAFVLPSRYESQPISLIEAMARGSIVIASDVNGIRETIIDGKNGFLIKPEDTQSLSNSIRFTLSNSRSLQLIKKNARKTAEKYKYAIIFQRILSVYQSTQFALSSTN